VEKLLVCGISVSNIQILKTLHIHTHREAPTHHAIPIHFPKPIIEWKSSEQI